MSGAIDLGHLGLGAHEAGPQTPLEALRDVRVNLYAVHKAHRAWSGVDPLCLAAGLSRRDIARIRPLGMAVESLVYSWDHDVEAEQDRRETSAVTTHGDDLARVLDAIGVEHDYGRRQLDGLARYWAVESEALVSGYEPVRFAELAHLRSSDLRIVAHWVLTLAGYPDPERIVDVLAPVLEVGEVVDDLESVETDEREGRFNTYTHVRGALSPDRARAELDAFARERADRLGAGLAQLPPRERAMVLRFLLRLGTGDPPVRTALLALVRPLTAGVVSRLACPLVARAFGPYWSRMERTGREVVGAT